MSPDVATARRALEAARALVQADGGDLVVDGVEGTVVHARLVIEGAACAECVMPRQFLEQVALDMAGSENAGITAVRIVDPREI